MVHIQKDFVDAAHHLAQFGEIFQGWGGGHNHEEELKRFYLYACQEFLELLAANAVEKEE